MNNPSSHKRRTQSEERPSINKFGGLSNSSVEGFQQGVRLGTSSTPNRQHVRTSSTSAASEEHDCEEVEVSTTMTGKKNLTWDDDMDDMLIDSLTDQMHKRQKINGSFTRNAYATVASLISLKFGMSCHSENVKNRMKTLKSNFSEAKDVLNSSGFGFNQSTQRIEATTSVWETYIKAHPKASKLRYKCIRNYEKMDLLVGEDRATGNLAAGPRERLLHMNEDEMTPPTSEHDINTDHLEDLEAATTAATSATKEQPRKKKKQKKGNEDVVEGLNNLRGGMDSIAAVLEKSMKMNFETAELLLLELGKVEGMSQISLMQVYSHLTDNMNQLGMAFLAIKDTGLRRIWLEIKFGADIFDI